MLLVNAVNTEGRPLEIFVKDGIRLCRKRYSAPRHLPRGTAFLVSEATG